FPSIFPVSAIHGVGVEALMAAALPPVAVDATLQSETDPDPEHTETDAEHPAESPTSGTPLKLAIIGRPNVGKSSIINALTHAERVIVSAVPGTTRDAVDVAFEVDIEGRRESYVLIDTAGLRKSRRVNDSIEFFSVKRTEDSVARCDLA